MAAGAVFLLAVDTERSSHERFEWMAQELGNVIGFILDPTIENDEWKPVAALAVALTLIEPEGVLNRYGIATLTMGEIGTVAARAIELAERCGDEDLIIQAESSTGELKRRRGEPVAALDLLQRALGRAETRDTALDRVASIKVKIGNTLLDLHDYPAAENAMRSALADAVSSGEIAARAQATGQLGQVLLRMGRFDESRDFYLQALSMYQEIGIEGGIAACSANLAEITARQQDVAESWRLHLQSLDAEIRDRNVNGAMGSLEVLARLVRNDDQLDLVISRIDHVLGLAPPTVQPTYAGVALSVKASAMIALRKLEEARVLLGERLTNAQARDDHHGQAIALGTLSEVAASQDDYRLAMELNARSRQSYEACEMVSGVLVCLNNGTAYAIKAGELVAARANACSAIKLAALRGDLETVVRIAYLLATEILPGLNEIPAILYPVGEHSYRKLLGIIAGAADACEVGRVLGAVERTIKDFGPGGIARSVVSDVL